MSQLWCIDPNNGKISIRIIACQLGGIFAAVRQVNGDCASVVNDVAVGQNKSIRRDHESGPIPADFALSTSCADALFYIDVNYSRRQTRDCADQCARICVEQLGIIWLCLDANWL